ncbi:MAG: hypothetical protein QNK05_08855 [Myxococcota bacterium]|nr:hypothetical protein [Myxococcota bacterium]
MLRLPILFACLALAGAAQGAVLVPADSNLQGQLLDDAGLPLVGPVAIEIAVFDAPVAGNLLYSELHDPVELRDGLFDLLIGTGQDPTPAAGFGPDLFSEANRYLEVRVDTGAGLEVLDPRLPISSVPYALSAAQAADAETLGGVAASAYLQAPAPGANLAVGDAIEFSDGTVQTTATVQGPTGPPGPPGPQGDPGPAVTTVAVCSSVLASVASCAEVCASGSQVVGGQVSSGGMCSVTADTGSCSLDINALGGRGACCVCTP